MGGDYLGQDGQGSPTAPTVVRGAMEPPGVSPRRLSAALFESNSGSNLLINTPLQSRQVLREDNAAPSKDITKSAPQQQTILSLWTANPLRHRPERGRREEEERGEGGYQRMRRGLHRGAPFIARGAVERASGAHLMSTSRPAEQSARCPTSRSPPATQDQQPKTPSQESTGQPRPATTIEAHVNTEYASAINKSARLPPKARRTPRGRQPIRRKLSPERAPLHQEDILRSRLRATKMQRQASPASTLPSSIVATRREASDAPT